MSALKDKLFSLLTDTNAGERLVFFAKKVLGKLPSVDLAFPALINLEIASVCNLSCIHCPSHLPSLSGKVKRHGLMDLSLFYKAMDEIDAYGPRRLSLHKDGEPLLHPEIINILSRVKQHQPHFVTLITNGHFLTDEISDAILHNRIDEVIFSIGAASRQFYEKIRGRGFDLVIENILRFLKKCENYHPAPCVTVQIVRLSEFPEMESEIQQFRNFWRGKGVDVMVYEKLNWGIFPSIESKVRRYPCPLLWRSLFVHWDGKVSACCIDWDQSLVIGDFCEQRLAEIWSGDTIWSQRILHVSQDFSSLSLCKKCNYWSTISRLDMKNILIRKGMDHDPIE